MYNFKKLKKKLIKADYFPLMTNFYIFALKIETNWAKRVVKPILEIWNAADVIVYVWFIHSVINDFENMQCEKE